MFASPRIQILFILICWSSRAQLLIFLDRRRLSSWASLKRLFFMVNITKRLKSANHALVPHDTLPQGIKLTLHRRPPPLYIRKALRKNGDNLRCSTWLRSLAEARVEPCRRSRVPASNRRPAASSTSDRWLVPHHRNNPAGQYPRSRPASRPRCQKRRSFPHLLPDDRRTGSV